MKRVLIAFSAFALTTSVMAQTKSAAPATTTTAVQQKKADDLVKFTEVKHDFGKN